MRRKVKETIKELVIGFVLGAVLMGSFLFFGLRARADGVYHAELNAIPRNEIVDMHAREEWVAPEPEQQAITYTPEATTYTGDELDLLAALVWAEAGDQPIPEGLYYVCDVVLNRVASPAWPNSITEVIFQSGQFSVVYNGALDRAFQSCPQVCYEAVLHELQGPRANYDIQYFSMGYCANGTLAFVHGTHYYAY